MEKGEEARGHLQHKAWIRLINWQILYWSGEELKAAVSSFGELWEVDALSSRQLDVSCFRVRVRCQDVKCIPKVLFLTVEDRRFHIPIAVDSWEEAEHILLGEVMDQRLGLAFSEAQEEFIKKIGFSSIPAVGLRGPTQSLVPYGWQLFGGSQRAPERGSSGMDRRSLPRTLSCSNLNSLPSDLPPNPLYSGPTLTLPICLSVSGASPPAGGQLVPTLSLASSPRAGGEPVFPSLAASPSDPVTVIVADQPPASSGHQVSLGLGPSNFLGQASKRIPDVLAANYSAQTGPSCKGFPAPRNFLPHRRSSHLAAKYKGVKKSSLIRAQDLMCKKLKLVRFAAKAACSSSSASLAPFG